MIRIYDASVLKSDFEEPFYERDTSSITEQAGYVDAQTQVTRMLVAGATLQDFRRGLKASDFEYPDGDVPNDVVPDPTENVGFDMADASQMMLDFNQKVGAVEAAKRQQQTVQKEGVKGETSPVSGVPSTSST